MNFSNICSSLGFTGPKTVSSESLNKKEYSGYVSSTLKKDVSTANRFSVAVCPSCKTDRGYGTDFLYMIFNMNL